MLESFAEAKALMNDAVLVVFVEVAKRIQTILGEETLAAMKAQVK